MSCWMAVTLRRPSKAVGALAGCCLTTLFGGFCVSVFHAVRIFCLTWRPRHEAATGRTSRWAENPPRRAVTRRAIYSTVTWVRNCRPSPPRLASAGSARGSVRLKARYPRKPRNRSRLVPTSFAPHGSVPAGRRGTRPQRADPPPPRRPVTPIVYYSAVI